MQTEPTKELGDNGDTLTVSYMCGYHKRDDEVRLLKKEVAILKEALLEAKEALEMSQYSSEYEDVREASEKALASISALNLGEKETN